MKKNSRPQAYLAGATVFHRDAPVLFAKMKLHCEAVGIEGIAPTDSEKLPDGLSKREAAQTIRQRNMQKIQHCDIVLADVSRFRGAGADDGTAWEMGYAEALGKLVVPYSQHAALSYAECVAIQQLNAPVVDRHEYLLDAQGLIIEDFDLPANLMIAAGKIAVQPSFAAALAIAAHQCDLRIGKKLL